MATGSTWGNDVQVTIYGESHGPCVGMVLSGLPAGEEIDLEELEMFMRRRTPGSEEWVTSRFETDVPEFISGVKGGHSVLTTTGSPIAGIIPNEDVDSKDYVDRWKIPRPGHADYTALMRYGKSVNLLGGGYLSARNTAALCLAGGIAKQVLRRRGIRVAAHLSVVGSVADLKVNPVDPDMDELEAVGDHEFPTISPEAASRMRTMILNASNQGDSIGGQVECAITGAPAGLGDPRFMSIESKFSSILFGIPAVKGVSFGVGFSASRLHGSEGNDGFKIIEKDGEKAVTRTANHAGGTEGGITNGMPIIVSLAFKPTASIKKTQQSVNLDTMEEVELNIGGRHDPCVAVRAVPVVEAACAIAIADIYFTSDYS